MVALGFQVTPEGRLSPPQDLFDDPAYDHARRTANFAADYMRRHGPFEPHRLPLADMEYTTLPGVEKALEKKMKDIK